MNINLKSFHSPLSTFSLILLAIIVFVSYAKIIHRGEKIVYSDYNEFYQSAQLNKVHKSLYTPLYVAIIKNNVRKIEHLGGNINPPFFSLFSYPFSYLSYAHSFVLWTLFSVGCGIISMLILYKIMAVPLSFNNNLALLLGFFIYLPTFVTLLYGQVTLLLMLMLMLGWYYLRNNQIILAAIILAIATSIKPFLGLFFLYFLLKQQWRPLFYYCGTGLICGFIGLLFFGKNAYIDYYTLLNHITWYAATFNASIFGNLVRIFGSSYEKNIALIHQPTLTHFLYYIISILFIFWLAHFIRKPNYNDVIKKTDLDFSLIIVIALLTSPLGWLYYFSWLIIPYTAILRYTKNNSQSIQILLLLGLIIIASSIPSANCPSTKLILFSKSWNCALLYCFALLLLVYLINFVAKEPASANTVSAPTINPVLIITMYMSLLVPSLLELMTDTSFYYYTGTLLIGTSSLR